MLELETLIKAENGPSGFDISEKYQNSVFRSKFEVGKFKFWQILRLGSESSILHFRVIFQHVPAKTHFGYNQKWLFSKIQPMLSVARTNLQMLSTEKLQENDGQECAKHSFQGFFTKKASRSRNTSSLSDVERVKCRKVTLRTSFIIKSEVIRQF